MKSPITYIFVNLCSRPVLITVIRLCSFASSTEHLLHRLVNNNYIAKFVWSLFSVHMKSTLVLQQAFQIGTSRMLPFLHVIKWMTALGTKMPEIIKVDEPLFLFLLSSCLSVKSFRHGIF